MLVGDLAQYLYVTGVVEPHAPRPLDDRLGDDSGYLVAVAPGQFAHLRFPAGVDAFARRRSGGKNLLGQSAAEQVVHPAHRVAHRHRPQRVAVVAAGEGQEPGPLRPAHVRVVLHAHLHGDLHGDRPGVGKENTVQAWWGQSRQASGQLDGRRVGQAAEHDVGHAVQLFAYGGVEGGVAVAPDRRPPRGHGVHQLAPVGQAQAHARRRDHGQRRRSRREGSIRVPDVVPVIGQQLGPFVGLGHGWSQLSPMRRQCPTGDRSRT